MESIRHHDYFPSIPAAEQHPTLYDQEDTKACQAAAVLPFRIYLGNL